MKINCILDACHGQVQSRNERLGLRGLARSRLPQVCAGGHSGKIQGNTEQGCAHLLAHTGPAQCSWCWLGPWSHWEKGSPGCWAPGDRSGLACRGQLPFQAHRLLCWLHRDPRISIPGFIHQPHGKKCFLKLSRCLELLSTYIRPMSL